MSPPASRLKATSTPAPLFMANERISCNANYFFNHIHVCIGNKTKYLKDIIDLNGQLYATDTFCSFPDLWFVIMHHCLPLFHDPRQSLPQLHLAV